MRNNRPMGCGLVQLARAATVVGALMLTLAAPAHGAGWLKPHTLTEADGVDPKVGVFADGEALVVWGPHGPSSAEVGARGVEASFGDLQSGFAEPQLVGGPGSIIPELARSSSGHTALGVHAGGAVEVRVRPPGGAFGPANRIPTHVNTLAVDGHGNASSIAMGFAHPIGSESLPPMKLRVVTTMADGSPGPARDVATHADVWGPSIAADERGRVTVAWVGWEPGQRPQERRVYVVAAEPGEPFGAPVAVSAADNSTTGQTRTLANARGDTLVLWTRNARPGSSERIAGAYRPAGGSFGSPDTVPVPNERSDGLYRWDAALGPEGEALVAWDNHRSMSMSYRPPAGPFEAAHPATPYPPCCEEFSLTWDPPWFHEPSVAIDAAGNGMVAYATRHKGKSRIEMVRRARGGEFVPPQAVDAGTHAFTPDIVIGDDGRALVAWSPQERMGRSSERRDHGIYAAVYDPALPPAVRTVRVARRRLGIEVTESGRATMTFKRKARRRYRRVAVHRLNVVPGYNRLRLNKRARRRLARRGRYVAEVRMVNAVGKRSPLKRKPFRALR